MSDDYDGFLSSKMSGNETATGTRRTHHSKNSMIKNKDFHSNRNSKGRGEGQTQFGWKRASVYVDRDRQYSIGSLIDLEVLKSQQAQTNSTRLKTNFEGNPFEGPILKRRNVGTT